MSIHVISGMGETAISEANGLNDLALRLRAAHPDQIVNRWGWSDWSAIDDGFNDGQPILLIGHSFGGCTAVMRSRQLEPLNIGVHLILIDPVRHRRIDSDFNVPFKDNPAAQVGGRPFVPGSNWLSATAYLRGGIWYIPHSWPSVVPFHQGIDLVESDAPRLRNVVVDGVDHNSICQSDEVVGAIFSKANILFPLP